MVRYCQCYRRNPDEQLRELERRALSTGDEADWDAYLSAWDRTGQLAATLQAIKDRFRRVPGMGHDIRVPCVNCGGPEGFGGSGHAVGCPYHPQGPLYNTGGEVSSEEAALITRVQNYRYRNGLLPITQIQNDLRDWTTPAIRYQILQHAGVSGSAAHIPESLSGYYWLERVEHRILRVHPWTPNYYLFHVYASGHTPTMPKSRRRGYQLKQAEVSYFHRIFLVCPVCSEEIPTGRIWNHFTAVSHGAPATRRQTPLPVVMKMLSRRLPDLVGEDASNTSIGHSGNDISVTTLPEHIEVIKMFLASHGLQLLREGPVTVWDNTLGEQVVAANDPRIRYVFVRSLTPTQRLRRGLAD